MSSCDVDQNILTHSFWVMSHGLPHDCKGHKSTERAIILSSLKVRVLLVGILDGKFLEEKPVQDSTSVRFQQAAI